MKMSSTVSANGDSTVYPNGEQSSRHVTIIVEVEEFSNETTMATGAMDMVKNQYGTCIEHMIAIDCKGDKEHNKGYVSITIDKYVGTEELEGLCIISVIDAAGKHSFRRTFEFCDASNLSTRRSVFIEKYISRDTLLKNSDELLPNDTLTLEIDMYLVNPVVNEQLIDLYKTMLSLDSAFQSTIVENNGYKCRQYSLVLDSPLGKSLSKNSTYFQNLLVLPMIEEKKGLMNLPTEEYETFRSIGKIVLGIHPLIYDTVGDILLIYRLADKYDIPVVINTCKCFLKLYFSEHPDYLRCTEELEKQIISEYVEKILKNVVDQLKLNKLAIFQNHRPDKSEKNCGSDIYTSSSCNEVNISFETFVLCLKAFHEIETNYEYLLQKQRPGNSKERSCSDGYSLSLCDENSMEIFEKQAESVNTDLESDTNYENLSQKLSFANKEDISNSDGFSSSLYNENGMESFKKLAESVKTDLESYINYENLSQRHSNNDGILSSDGSSSSLCNENGVGSFDKLAESVNTHQENEAQYENISQETPVKGDSGDIFCSDGIASSLCNKKRLELLKSPEIEEKLISIFYEFFMRNPQVGKSERLYETTLIDDLLSPVWKKRQAELLKEIKNDLETEAIGTGHIRKQRIGDSEWVYEKDNYAGEMWFGKLTEETKGKEESTFHFYK